MMFATTVRAQIISTVAGTDNLSGLAATDVAIGFPNVAIDSKGNYYYCSDADVYKVNYLTNKLTKIAGCNLKGYSGNGYAATSARLRLPNSVAVDAIGNVYISDRGNNCIRKVDVNGIISTVAGNGNAGYSGDGGQATSAKLYDPKGLALDKQGNLYIVDGQVNVVRKISVSGIISTVAGNASSGYSGDGGLAVSAQLYTPSGITVDAIGNLYIADLFNHRIRKVDVNGIISTVAGNGTTGYSGDGGQATSAELSEPLGVAVDTLGNLYIADFGDNRIRKVNKTGIISTVAGNSTRGFGGDGNAATLALFSEPNGIAVDKFGSLYIADNDNYRIRKVNINGIVSTIAGDGTFKFSGDGRAATTAELSRPSAVTFDTKGNEYIYDSWNYCVRKITTNGIISTIIGNGHASDQILNQGNDALATDKAGNVFIGNDNLINKITPDGTISIIAGVSSFGFSGDGGPAIKAQLFGISSIAFDAYGNMYFSDGGNYRIRKVDITGIISTVVGTGISGFSGDGGSATVAELNSPKGIAIDRTGNLYIVDGNRVRKVSTNGIITSIAGNGQNGFAGDGGLATKAILCLPNSIAIDASNNLYIVDGCNNRVRKISANGIISTVAGNGAIYLSSGESGYSGDGGLATSAQLNSPNGIAVDANGNIHISDAINNRIRKVTFNPLPVTFITFDATLFNESIIIKWQTATELNTSNFIISHSENGIEFNNIGSVKATGSGANSYEFIDYTPTIGTNYYRLQSMDKDGSSSYSKVVSINFGDNQSFSIIPNPARDFATISFSKTVDKATIAVYDITGKAVITQSLSGTNSYKLNTQTLTNGVYVIKVKTATGSYNEKLLINK
ncbi:T9SS type A sorting domain-containing protein [Parasediminibacterium sp. JCM 36343]|uniref:NHL domain-containing protein n=1 Tax=Parasediminibacterium sp. JCM 36343 TaxID=3374279 RepID=UPI00397BB8E9